MSVINTENIFGKDGFVWFIGVVEDRKEDPDKLGRVRVRIMGYHSDDLEVLPTDQLPWAIVMQPTTSAAISGIGTSPTNLMEGTWVIGFFLDGKEKQQPLVIGTIGGFTQKVPFCGEESPYESVVFENTLRTADGTGVFGSDGGPIPIEIDLLDGMGDSPTIPDTVAPLGVSTTPSTAPVSSFVENALPSMSRQNVQALMNAIGLERTNNNYAFDSGDGRVGKYQFTSSILEERGLLRRGAFVADGQRAVYNEQNWNNPVAPTLQSFLGNGSLQERTMFQTLESLYRRLTATPTPAITAADLPARVSGMLAASFLGGVGAARMLATTGTPISIAGSTTRNYYDLGFVSAVTTGTPTSAAVSAGAARDGIPVGLAGSAPALGATVSRDVVTSPFARVNPRAEYFPSADIADWEAINALELVETEAFQDPNKEFPRCLYVGKPDTNKLATGDVVGQPDTAYQKRLDDLLDYEIPTALGGPIWVEPPPPYCAEYPFNQVFESESGHVIEIDNTKGRERIHIYHRTGTYVEINELGSVAKKTKGGEFKIVEKDDHVFVMGNKYLTVENVARIYVKDNAYLQVDGDMFIQANKNLNLDVAENLKINVGGSMELGVGGGMRLNSAGPASMASGTGVSITGPVVSLNDKVKVGGAGILLDARTHVSSAFSYTKVGLEPMPMKTIGPIFVASPGQAEPVESPPLEEDTRFTEDPLECILEIPEPIEFEPEPEFFAPDPVTSGVDSYLAPSAPRIQEVYESAYVEEVAVTQTTPDVSTLPTYDPYLSFVDPGSNIPTVDTSYIDLNSINVFPPRIVMSRYYTMGDLTSSIINQVEGTGITPQEGARNLRFLAINALDPILTRYPDMRLMNGLIPPMLDSFVFARDRGQAALMQFTSARPNQYIEIASWIRDNVPYSQLILNYRNDPTRGMTSAIGLSLGAQSAVPRVATTIDGTLYTPYLFSAI